MEKRSKCDVIPVWMFKELDAGAKMLVQEAKTNLNKVKDAMIKTTENDYEEIAWNYIKDKKIEDCFEYSGGSWHPSFRLKSKISNDIEKKQHASKKELINEYDKKIEEIDKKYNQWKMNILTGKIPRSRVKGFEL